MTALHAACLALALSACGSEVSADSAPPATRPAPAEAAPPGAPSASPYRFDRPVARFELPDELVEISALTVLDDGSLGAVQDEDGDLYVLSPETGRVTAVVPFGPPGDYEGIELVGDRLFVLRADGAVLELDGWDGDEARATTYETGLGAKACDAEGLGTDGERLLIACKKEDDDGFNRVYAFDLDANALLSEPVLVLDRDAVPGEKKLRPSALAVHPLTGHTVVLSSKREALVSLDADGAVVDAWDLGPAAFEQPEGLAFLPNGDAFVSSEGGDGPAVLVRFAYEPAP
ncbi:SdiA-regulated domain-containing protein [Rubrivirga sp. S365]|uniref:SdiA-regulated domain-containing protein n=1 Tax=Rubrivirga litoralis TaxID=3075598 RepID=A0ABU3BND4_9BACT|nr:MULTISPECIES: SdiA-regulated domain-containing protein [unclassified Rubrivirga]MDT0630812.1 SdiA-regulated domain-containing protein [Rubrivirga sp. F394]MDT7857364.1 SdiA-regulated domain-containing protein [Rubrivirga sp. S365]